MQQIVISTLVFTVIVLVLSGLVLGVRRLLGFSGSVNVRFEDGRILEVGAGQKLLWALSEAGIYLPSACGGKGSCGQCRIRILEGCPELSLMGKAHINPADAAAGCRLACMVRVWDDMFLSAVEGAADTKKWSCTVASNRSISVYLRELVLDMPDGDTVDFRAGDYVQVEVPPYSLSFRDLDIDQPFISEWQRLGLLALSSSVDEPTIRAYSLANPPVENRQIQLVVRIALPPAAAPEGTPPGRASSYLFSLRPGDVVPVLGPFGGFHATESDSEMVLIAGGAGIAPIRSIILDRLQKQPGRRMSLWYGARDRQDLVYLDEFERLAVGHQQFTVQAVLSSPRENDEWQGETGFVHSVVHKNYLSTHPAPGAAEYYLCGPPLMSAAILQMLDELGVPGERIFLDEFGS